jgi:ubiquinone/menaquinone biosynthesis C-methylase UbiE
MISIEYERMFLAEEHHWWYQGMAKITRSILDQWYKTDSHLTLLDAGCGTGGSSLKLTRYGRVIGCDISMLALRLFQQRGANQITQASVSALPFADASFDVVTCFDVLYGTWFTEETAAYNEIFRVLKPNSRFLLRLPALSWMHRNHDVAVNTRHRYTREEVGHALRQIGFHVELCAYANTFLFPFALAKKYVELIFPSSSPESDLTMESRSYDSIASKILALESPFVLRELFPLGLSVFAVGRKMH